MRQGGRRGARRRLGGAVATLIAILVAAGSSLTMSPATAQADSASAPKSAAKADFTAGEIISDDNFFNYESMTLSGVQHFLASVDCVPRDDSPCLSDYSERTRSVKASPGRCTAYSGRRSESAASIVWRVAQTCKVNPEVLLVLVQKEQSLLTHPSASGYQKATGYACPDTAPCNARYYGFFNQVYAAAWQFREYTLHPHEWRYRIGHVTVAYNPSTACGSREIDIRNQATANLYNYTPYQPDAQTIAHPDGPAGSCSSYGNLNFSRLYRHWFGDPLTVTFGGWAPACLNFVGGRDCAAGNPFDLIPATAYGTD